MTNTDPPTHPSDEAAHDPGDLKDLLEEVRILLPGVQVLTAFLIVLPFNSGFAKIDALEKWIYLVTFCCAISSLILLSEPAIAHRLERPLRDRAAFKRHGTRMAIAGTIPLSVALVLVSHLVVTEVFSGVEGTLVAAGVAALIGVLWWLLPLRHKHRKQS